MSTRAESLDNLFHEMSLPGTMISIQGTVCGLGPKGIIAQGISAHASLEDFISVKGKAGEVLAEVVQINPDQVVARAIDPTAQIYLGDKVQIIGKSQCYPSEQWKGRIINALGEPLDGKGVLPAGATAISHAGKSINAVDRQPVGRRLVTGVHVVDVFTPLCHGQRIGIFAGSGVGKSTLLGMMAGGAEFDCVVVALVGERGREVSEFINEVLGAALQKSVVVVATGDEAASMRKRAALMATSLAEWFRDAGQNVLLIMDSVTRFAQALRDLALAAGEPPVSRGFPPSVFAALPLLMERAGPGPKGTGNITGIYSVLVDGDNHNDPVADAVRGILDGHIVLDRRLAGAGRYPALDVLRSISRLIQKALTPAELAVTADLRNLILRFEETRDLRALGSYQPGKDAELDRAVALVPQIYTYFNQRPGTNNPRTPFKDMGELLSRKKA